MSTFTKKHAQYPVSIQCSNLSCEITSIRKKIFITSRLIGTVMKKKFSILIERDEDGYYVATVPALPGCHTQARSLDELMARTKEAIEAYLETETDIEPSEFVGVQVVEAEAGRC
jgi:predicted RNase H-like HicB family nuclease